MLFTDGFSRRAEMFPVIAAEFTAEGTTNVLVNPLSPCGGTRAPYSRTTDCSSALSFHKLHISCWVCTSLAKSSYHPNCNGGVERVNHYTPNAGYGRQ